MPQQRSATLCNVLALFGFLAFLGFLALLAFGAFVAFAGMTLWADEEEPAHVAAAELADDDDDDDDDDEEMVGDGATVDVPYGKLPRQKLDVYAPIGAKKAPVLVFFHGGAWSLGNKEIHAFVGKSYAKEGVVTVVPNYRLYPKVRFPNFMEDAALAVKWVRANVERYGGDPDHIILAGHSAGGHIASLLGTDQKYLDADAGEQPEWLRGVISVAGVLDTPLSLLGPARKTFEGSRREEVMPISFIDKGDPPFLLVQGGLDPLVHSGQAKSFEAALKKSEVEVVTSYLKFAEHGLVLFGFTGHIPRVKIMNTALEFIRDHAPKA